MLENSTLHDELSDLWDLALESPGLQRAIIKNMATEQGLYSIPTGDITISVFDKEDTPEREKIITAIKQVQDMKIKDLAKILKELRIDLIVQEVNNPGLADYEKTLRDIDITALATFAYIRWLVALKERTDTHDN